MVKSRSSICFVLLSMVALLSACSDSAATPAAQTVTEMEMTENYDTSEPFIHEKLFCVEEDIDTLYLDVSFQMEGESGVLEIADNKTKEVIWNDAWKGDVDSSTFTMTLDGLEQEKEYVVRFTGTEIAHMKMAITSENSLVQERERPERQSYD